MKTNTQRFIMNKTNVVDLVTGATSLPFRWKLHFCIDCSKRVCRVFNSVYLYQNTDLGPLLKISN